MKNNTAAIIARLNNREGVTYYPSEKRSSPKGYVVTGEGDVCPLDTMRESGTLSPIRIEDGGLVCDNTVASTNTDFDVNGKYDLDAAVGRHNNTIDEKLRQGDSSDDEYRKIVNWHAF